MTLAGKIENKTDRKNTKICFFIKFYQKLKLNEQNKLFLLLFRKKILDMNTF